MVLYSVIVESLQVLEVGVGFGAVRCDIYYENWPAGESRETEVATANLRLAIFQVDLVTLCTRLWT